MRPSCRDSHLVSIQFLLTALVVVATPGTGVVYTLQAGLARGGQAGLVAALGCTLGIVPQMLATVTGVATLLAMSPWAFLVVKYLGVGYLLVMAVTALRGKDTALELDQTVAPRSRAGVIGSAVMLNLLNPKLLMFFVAFLPQFVSTDGPGAVPRMLALSGVFMALTFLVFTGYGLLAALVRDRVAAQPRLMTWLRRAFAVSFVGLGVRLALVSR
jgi:threonine/homoserine/homoserine lactone efflux protein